MMRFGAIYNRMGLRKFAVFLIVWVLFAESAAGADTGNYNPFVAQGVVTPAPLPPVEFGGKGVVSFKVGNTGSDALDVWSALPGEGVELVISLALCVPDVEPLTAETALAALDGEYSSKFSWSYDTATAVFTGRQIASIPASGVGLISLAIRVTRNSASTQVGFSTTLTPPEYASTSNSINDDKVSSYTWTEYRDYGDAPAVYGVAYHRIQENPDFRVMLGRRVDGEFGALHSAGADGDDFDGDDDEDGIALPFLIRGTTVTVPVEVRLSSYLNGWVDWNQDGDFLDEGEKVVSDRLITAPGGSFGITVPKGVPEMMHSYARFRLGPRGLGPSGGATSGEVEDYQVHILPSPPFIAGNVYDDHDQMDDNLVDGTGTNFMGSLFVNLLSSDSLVVASTEVSEDGTYFFGEVTTGSYCLQLTTVKGIPGEPCPPTLLPRDAKFVAETLGDGPGCDGDPDGRLYVVVQSQQEIVYANFGVARLPDLTVNVTATPNIMGGITHFSLVVRVSELNQMPTRGTVTVVIPRDSRWNLPGGFDPNLGQIDQVELQNGLWTYLDSDPNYLVFSTESEIPAGGSLIFGLKGLFNPANSRGVCTLTGQIYSGSGGEYLLNNNVDSEKLEYFPD